MKEGEFKEWTQKMKEWTHKMKEWTMKSYLLRKIILPMESSHHQFTTTEETIGAPWHGATCLLFPMPSTIS